MQECTQAICYYRYHFVDQIVFEKGEGDLSERYICAGQQGCGKVMPPDFKPPKKIVCH